MNKYFKKFSIMFIMSLILSLGFCISAFADNNESIKINNTTLNFNRIIYVDGTNGDNDTGDGSIEKPYKSITKAQEVAIDGNAIYIRKGTYDLSSTGRGLWETKHKLSFIGEPNGTIIVSDGNKNNVRDNHAAAFEKECSIYNIIFKYTAGNRRTNYSCALVGNGYNMSTQQYGSFYNCVFLATDKAPAPCYGNKDINVNFNNCSFIIPDNFQNTYIMYGKDKTEWLNCAISKNAYKTDTTGLGNLSFSNNDYSIISDGWENTGTGTNPDGTKANIGVYGGEFAWGNWAENGESISLNKSSINLTEGTSEQLTATMTDGSNASDSCIVNVIPKDTEPTEPDPTEQEYIINTAYAKGDNTNNGSGAVTIIFHGSADTTLSVVKTADIEEVWVGDNFTYTIVVTNTGSKTAKDVVIRDSAPNHIEFNVDGITTTQGEVDSSTTSSNLIVNVGDIPAGGTVTIKIPVTVVQ